MLVELFILGYCLLSPLIGLALQFVCTLLLTPQFELELLYFLDEFSLIVPELCDKFLIVLQIVSQLFVGRHQAVDPVLKLVSVRHEFPQLALYLFNFAL